MKTTIAKKASQIDQAVIIFQKHLGKDNHKQLCLAEFISTLGQKESTAATYYYLAEKKINAKQAITTDVVIASNRKTKFSSVKFARGTDNASRVHCFFTKKAAVEFNAQHNYNQVVRGVQQLGKQVGVVAA